MKLAFQYFGEIRFFDIFSQMIGEYKELSNKFDCSIDFHITTWKNDYTSKLDLSMFDSSHLIESPQDGLMSLLPKKYNKENREGASRGFFNPSYSMFWGAYNRLQYQKVNNINYDWIILIRPDFIFLSKDFFNFVKELRNTKFHDEDHVNDFHIIYSKCWKHLDSKWSAFSGQDVFWLGSQEGIDLFCKNFHLCFLNDDGGFISTYHNLPKQAIDRYHLFHDTVDETLYPYRHKISTKNFAYKVHKGRMTIEGKKRTKDIDERVKEKKKKLKKWSSLV